MVRAFTIDFSYNGKNYTAVISQSMVLHYIGYTKINTTREKRKRELGMRAHDTSLLFFKWVILFYVKTACRIDTKAIEGYKTFHHLKLLEPYLETIAIDDLLN